MRRKTGPATCHPDRPARTRGLCASCYGCWLRTRDPDKHQRLLLQANKAGKLRRDRRTPEQLKADSVVQRQRALKHRYGISSEKYEEMNSSQNGCCAICDKRPKNNRRLAVDHCHQTGRIRGLLCDNCNHAISLIDDPERLEKSMLYILKK